MLHIRDSLPDIKIRIVALLNSVQVQIFTYPSFHIYNLSFIILILIILLFIILLHFLFSFFVLFKIF